MKDDEQLSLFGSGDVVDVDHAKKFEVPTVDTVPVVHAHWKYGKNGVFWCSTCECIPATKSKFCPSCGAKMDGDENG